MNPLAQKIKEAFIKRYKSEPGIYFSPGRINLIGEHIDYNDGYVMPCAINKGMYFAVSPNGKKDVSIFSRDYQEECKVSLTSVAPDEGWKNYVLSVINEFQKDGKVLEGFNCLFGANVPSGAGLSSSAALEGGLAFALNDIFSLGYNPKQLALLCQRAEHGFPQVNCGIMDQFANMLGKENSVILLDCKDHVHSYLPLNPGDYRIVLINTKVHHALAASAYNTRRTECETGLKIIRENTPFKSFRDVHNSKLLQKLEDKMGKYVWKRCTYVVDEIQRTLLAAKFLKKGKLKDFGTLMFKSHEGLSELFKVSCAELDFLVKVAEGYPGVIGARMMGGGFGGCTINIVHKDNKEAFVATSLDKYKKEFQSVAESYDVVTADGTHLVTEDESGNQK